MASADLVDAALEWAGKDMPVFPCAANKRPLTQNGFYDATTDPEQVRFLFENAPNGSLIGLRTGKESGVFVVDFDLYKPGAEDYMKELANKGLLTETQVHITAGGGLHYVYKSSNDFPNCSPHEAVDVKGEGGYVILPPSNGYSIHTTGIKTAPAALVAALMAAKTRASMSTLDELKKLVLTAKSFHDPLAQIAARRSGQGVSVEVVQRELLELLQGSVASAEKHKRHNRWLSIINDDDGELTRITFSGYSKYNASARTASATDKIRGKISQDAVDSASAIFGTGSTPEPKAVNVDNIEDEPWPFDSDGYSSLDDREIFDQQFVMYPLLAENETSMLAAEPKTGKSAIALKMAMAIANGESIGDALQVSQARPVLYFSLEGVRAIEMRIEAEKQHRKQQDIPPPKQDMLFVVTSPFNFLESSNQKSVGDKIIVHDHKCKDKFGTGLGLIVIDTLTKAMPGGDQNSVEDTSKLFEIVDHLRFNGVTANVMLIHHLSRQGNVRGSTNLEAEPDLLLSMRAIKNSTDMSMIVRMARSISDDISFRWALTNHNLGKTKQGHELRAPLVNLVEASGAQDSTSSARNAKIKADVSVAISELGDGKYGLAQIVPALAEWITQPSGRRASYETPTIKKELRMLFKDFGTQWTYGNYIFKQIQKDEDIIGVHVLTAADQ